MERQKDPKKYRNFQSLPQKTPPTKKIPWWFTPFLFIIFILIKIGDAVRCIFLILPKIIKFASNLVQKGYQRTQILIVKKIKRKAGRPSKKKPLFYLPKIQAKLPEVEEVRLTFLKMIPKIKIPSLPSVSIIDLIKKIRRPPTIKPTVIMFVPPSTLTIKVKWFLLGAAFVSVFIFAPYIIYSWTATLPHPASLAFRDIPTTTKIFDRNGNLLYQIYAAQNRTPVKLNDIPQALQKATVAIEDRDFYHHQGYDLRAILRAIKETLINKHIQGGSTITQQLIRSVLLTPELTIRRKIKEIVLAFWTEKIYTKNQILEMYFNQVPYGGTAWGAEAAAETYFGKTVQELSLAEAALLAGLPAAPTTYSPFGVHPELAKVRQSEVLRRMVEDGYINKKQAEEAKNTPLAFVNPITEIKAPHFVLYIKDILVKKYGLKTVEQGGLRVETTLDLSTQEMAQEIVKNEIGKLSDLRVGNGAALITNPKTGEILAMVGSRDYFGAQAEKQGSAEQGEAGSYFDTPFQGNFNVTLALRQPGSAIKPVNYAAAFEKGFTAATVLDDAPVIYKTENQPPYAPVNYDEKFHGKMLLRYALGNSYNVPAVKTLAAIGVPAMLDMGKRLGITTWNETNRFGLSLTLGGGEVTMIDMAKAYGTLANSGRKIELNPILKVTDYRGVVLLEFKIQDGKPVVSPEISFILSDILADNNARTNAFGPNSQLAIKDHTVSVKTGTTNDKRDNWTIGYTPSVLTAVWVGNNDNSPMHPYLTSGVTGAAPIWNKIMTELLKNKEDEKMEKPEGVIAVQICSINGLLPCEGCPTRTEYFIKGTEPRAACTKIEPSPTPTSAKS